MGYRNTGLTRKQIEEIRIDLINRIDRLHEDEVIARDANNTETAEYFRTKQADVLEQLREWNAITAS